MQRWLTARWALIGVLLLTACGGQTTLPAAGEDAASGLHGELTVFAASSLTDAFQQIGRDFEAAHPETTVVLNVAGSQQLAQQLAQGAPADVFAAASARQMQVAVDAERIEAEAAQVFATNRLVVIVPADNPGGITTLADLAQPGLKLVLAAENVPAGSYARAFLDNAAASDDVARGYRAATLSNVVSYEQTVRAVLTKVVLGEADAGIVYTSDITPDAADAVRQIAIPAALNVTATYPIARVSDSAQPGLAAAFIQAVRAPQGQRTLAEFGFRAAD